MQKKDMQNWKNDVEDIGSESVSFDVEKENGNQIEHVKNDQKILMK
jgi:hypothetical protein